MVHPLYPLLLSLKGVPALVVGAGRVAERKVSALLRCGATVTVVAPLATRSITKWSVAGRLRWHRREFAVRDLRGQRLAFCATDHPRVDERVAQAARRRGLLVNCASLPELGNFIVPATARAGLVQLAVSTGGASPTLARRLARELAGELNRRGNAWAKLLQQLRPQVLRLVPRGERQALWRELAGEKVGRLIRGGKSAEARRVARQMIRTAVEASKQAR